MNLPAKSSENSVTYDSGKFDVQWRCNLHILLKPKSLGLLFIASLLLQSDSHELVFVSAPICLLLSLMACLAGISLFRSRKRRICYTTVNSTGLIDQTPSGTTTVPWSKVKSIEIVDKDIYFAVPLGAIFIPRCAFSSATAAVDYFRDAYQLKESARTGAILPCISSHDKDSVLIDHDEAKWLDLEKMHAQALLADDSKKSENSEQP